MCPQVNPYRRGREEASKSQSTRGLRLASIEADYSHQEQQCADQPQRRLDGIAGGQGLFAKVLWVSAEQLKHQTQASRISNNTPAVTAASPPSRTRFDENIALPFLETVATSGMLVCSNKKLKIRGTFAALEPRTGSVE